MNHKHILFGAFAIAIGLGVMLALTQHPTNTFAAPLASFFEVEYFSGMQNKEVDLNRQYGGQNIQGIMYRKDTIDITDTSITASGSTLTCTQQLRGLFVSSARGAVLWPLDADTLDALTQIEQSMTYSDLGITGGFFTDCDGDTSHVYGQISYSYNGLEHKIIAGVDVTTGTNSYALAFDSSLEITSGATLGYLVDDVLGITSLDGEGLEIFASASTAPDSETFNDYTGYTATGGIVFTNDETIAVGDTGANNYLTFDTTGFAIEVIEGTRDGILYAPTETEDPDVSDLPATTNTRTILLTIQAGASGASLESSGGTFTISFVVSGGTIGDIIPIYRSEDGIIWIVNTPDPNCELDADLVCTFETDHLSYFTVVRETAPSNNNSTLGGGGGGGGITTDSKAGICQARDCSDSYYDGVCGVCDPTKHKAAGTGDTLLIDSTTGFALEVTKIKTTMKGKFSDELIQAYVFAKDIGITTIDTIDKAMLTEPLIREHAAKMMVNYATNVLGMQADGTRTSCNYTDMNSSSTEMQLYARLACQLGIMGVESDAAKTPAKNFNGTAQVTRDQFGTMLSRTMYANDPVEVNSCWYCAHLNRLKTDGIMTKISNPSSKEVRGYVWLMMMRAYQNVISK